MMSSKVVQLNASLTVFIAIAGATGNAMIIFAFIKLKSLRTINNVFLFQLALVDLTKVLFILPVKAYTQLKAPGKDYDLGHYCQVSGFISTVTYILSALLLAAIAIVRYFKIVNTSSYGKTFTRKRMSYYCVGMLTATCALAIMPIVGIGDYIFSFHHGVCFTNWSKNNLAFRSLFYLVTIGICYPILIFCYTKIFIKLYKHASTVTANMRIQSNTLSMEDRVLSSCEERDGIKKAESATEVSDSHPNSSRTDAACSSKEISSKQMKDQEMIAPRNKHQKKVEEKDLGMTSCGKRKCKAKRMKKYRNEIRVTKVMFTVVITYSLCWFPAFIVNILQLSEVVSVSDGVLYLIITLVELKVVLNPLIYGLWNHQFRKAFKVLLFKNYALERTSNTQDQNDSKT